MNKRRDMTGFVPTTDVSIGIDALELDLGSTHTFQPQVFPSNATIQNVTYTSSDLSVARINPDGTLITGSEGIAQITVYDGTGEFSDTCTVTVASANPAVPVLYGYRMYSSANGIVNFSADDVSDFNLVDAQTGLEPLTAMCYVEGDFYGFAKSETENTGYDFVIIDGETFERRTTNIWSCYYCRDMTYDPETGLIYCMMATNATIYSLYFGIYTVNPQTLSFNLIGETNRYLSALGCRIDGGQAEYVRVPFADQGLNKIPDHVTDRQALLVGDVLATGFWAARISEIKEEDTVLIIGAGPTGICTLLCVMLKNPKRIIVCEKDEGRIRFIHEHYPEILTVSPEACVDYVRANSDHGGADVVLEVAGAESTFRLAWECARPNAVVTVVALYDKAQTLPLPDMYGKNLTFKTGGVDGCNCEEILRLIAEGRLNTEPLITHTYPLDRIEEAYTLFENKMDGVIKVAIEC